MVVSGNPKKLQFMILALRKWELNLMHIERILLKHLIILREANPLGFDL